MTIAIKFTELDCEWQIKEGCPQIGTKVDPLRPFESEMRHRLTTLRDESVNRIGAWIIGRLSYLSYGQLFPDRTKFNHDTNEIGFKIKAISSDRLSAHGAIMIQSNQIYFPFESFGLENFQNLVIELLTKSESDLEKYSIYVLNPETRRYRTYGYDGRCLIT